MARSFLLVVVGALAGSLLVVSVWPDQNAEIDLASDVTTGDGNPSVEALAPLVDGTAADAGEHTAARITAFQRAADAIDPLDIEAMIESVAIRPRSRARDLELVALVARLSELDAERAFAFAQASLLDLPYVLQTLQSLALADPDAAIAAIASVAEVPKRYRLALALLDFIGYDDQNVALVAQSLPQDARVGFEIDALVARAGIDPAGALEAVLSLEVTALKDDALARIGQLLAETDPEAALVLAGRVEDIESRGRFRAAVMSQWAVADPNAMLAYLETAEAVDLLASMNVFGHLAEADPMRLDAMADRFPPAARDAAMQALMPVIAERDASAALAMLDKLPPGPERETLLSAVGETLGRQDPDSAFVWARNLKPPSRAALQSVMRGIAAVDAERAIDLLLAELDRPGATQLGSSASIVSSLSLPAMISLIASNSGNVERIADRLLQHDDSEARALIGSIVSLWSSSDSVAAVNWALANADRIDAPVFRDMARNLVARDSDLATGILEQLPAEQRASWLEGMVARLATTNLDQALGLLDRYRGQPGFEMAFGVAAEELARTDPEQAARLLATATDVGISRMTLTLIAREWAMRDPQAAARWALSQRDEQIRSSGLGTIAGVWAGRDIASAESWVLGLSRGAGRDAAIDGYLFTAAAQRGEVNVRLLDAYSSEAARQRGASRAIILLNRTDPDQAARLLERYITDAEIRAETEAALARGTLSQGAIIVDGNAIFAE